MSINITKRFMFVVMAQRFYSRLAIKSLCHENRFKAVLFFFLKYVSHAK